MRTCPTLALLFCTTALAAQADHARTSELAREIDGFVAKALEESQQKANPIVDDATYVRRAYLQIVGRIPSADEVHAFLTDSGSDKRHRLVDRLLESPGRVSHEFHFWADLLRGRSRLMRQTSGEPFLHWIKESLAQNKPYDKMVREMLEASGPAHQRGHGATGYLLRDLEMPLDSMANTMRVFLGTRIECAQCHNHPFDKWTQLDFYKVAAFTGGVKYRADMGLETEQERKLRELARQLYEEHGTRAQQVLGNLRRNLGVGIEGGGFGLIRLPENYQYKDAQPNQVVAAKTPFGPTAQVEPQPVAETRRPQRPLVRPAAQKGKAPPLQAKDVGARYAFADWVVDEQNPRFAAVIANRLWKQVFGLGVVEPVDDFRDDTKASNPALLGRLEGIMVEVRFDMKEFERVLLYTKLFERAVPAEEPKAETAYLFPGPLLRRMSPEQFWDSLVTLGSADPDDELGTWGRRAEEVYARYDKFGTGDLVALKEEVEFQILRDKDPAKFRELQRERVREALMNGEAPPGSGKSPRRRDVELGLVRASELPSPAPDGHLLRQLGQSEREIVEGAHAEANVPELLTLMNGFVDQKLMANKESTLRHTLDAQKSVPDKITAMFVAVLSRKPTPAETTQWTSLLGREGGLGFVDLAWVLVNSNEFRFVR